VNSLLVAVGIGEYRITDSVGGLLIVLCNACPNEVVRFQS